MRSMVLPNLRILIAGLVLAGMAGVAGAENAKALTTVILVRHAEKVLGVDDPPLTPEGEERARALIHVLGGVDIDTIFSTPYKRTRATAAPLAEELGEAIVETPATATYPKDIARKIRQEHAGDVVVVVGHSNTTPDVIRALGVDEAPAIADGDYDNLFVVTFSDPGRPRLLALRYGRPSP